MKRFMGGALALALILGGLFSLGSAAAAVKKDNDKKVTICHAKPADTAKRGWVQITVNKAAIQKPKGHGTQHDMDIIPPFSYKVNGKEKKTVSYPGKNYFEVVRDGLIGQSILNAGCALPAPEPTDDPTTSDPEPTDDPTTEQPDPEPTPDPTETVTEPTVPTPTETETETPVPSPTDTDSVPPVVVDPEPSTPPVTTPADEGDDTEVTDKCGVGTYFDYVAGKCVALQPKPSVTPGGVVTPAPVATTDAPVKVALTGGQTTLEELPRTGGGSAVLIIAGVVLIIFGAALIQTMRRKP